MNDTQYARIVRRWWELTFAARRAEYRGDCVTAARLRRAAMARSAVIDANR